MYLRRNQFQFVSRVYAPSLVFFIALIISLLLTAPAASGRPVTDIAELQRLSAKYEQQYQDSRGEAFQQYVRDNGLERYLDLNDGIELMGLTPEGRPIVYILHNLDAAVSVRADQLWPGGAGYNVSGAGTNTLGIWDGGGVMVTHQEFGGRVTNMDTADSAGHATHVAGTLIAAGVVAQAKGMSYEANLDAWDWNNDLSEMASAAANNIRISNHSYGYGTGFSYNGSRWIWWGDPAIDDWEDWQFGFYSDFSQACDIIATEAPYYLIVTSAGNDRNDGWSGGRPYILAVTGQNSTVPRETPDGGPDGFDSMSHYSTAKNVITVGAVEDVTSYTGPGSVVMTDFSSWGPTDDGRVKPDIVANGFELVSSYYVDTDSYATGSGTSMASPNAAGTINLLHQYFLTTRGDEPLASTLKGLVIHTAEECGAWDGPDYSYGWGLLNAEAAAELILQSQTYPDILQEIELADGETYERGYYSDGQDSLRVTISWTDPAASVLPDGINNTSPRLVNDLDVRVTELSTGTAYYPYVLGGLADPGQAASTGDNILDNVEQVYIANPAAGAYAVTVTHKGSLVDPQWFSLAVSGMLPAGETVSTDVADNTWEIIGIPVELIDPADGIPTVLFGDDFTEPFGPPNWTMGRYNMTTHDYDMFIESGQNGDLPALIAPGLGYWIIHTEGAPTTINVDLSQNLGSPTGEVSITDGLPAHNGTRNGLQMFANPYNATYDVSNMTFGDAGLSWFEAGNTYSLNSNVYTWDGSQYVQTSYLSASLDPWEGFWLIRAEGSTDPINVTFSNGATADDRDLDEITLLSQRIQVESLDGQYADTYNKLGVIREASDQYDHFDAFELTPPSSGYVQFCFPHPEYQENPGRFAYDYRHDLKDLPMTWLAELRTVNLPAQSYRLTWPDISELSPNLSLKLYIEDGFDGIRYVGELRDLTEYVVDDSGNGEPVRLQFVLEDVNVLSVNDMNAETPADFAIQDAYPNPFNSTVNIRYTLPASGNVRAVVYDRLGRQVTELTNTSQPAGTHTLTWNAVEHASGVYFVQLEGFGQRELKKVMLLR